MLHYMNINTGTKRFMEAFATSAVNYFSIEKSEPGAISVKEGRGNPNFIGDFDLGKNWRFIILP